VREAGVSGAGSALRIISIAEATGSAVIAGKHVERSVRFPADRRVVLGAPKR